MFLNHRDTWVDAINGEYFAGGRRRDLLGVVPDEAIIIHRALNEIYHRRDRDSTQNWKGRFRRSMHDLKTVPRAQIERDKNALQAICNQVHNGACTVIQRPRPPRPPQQRPQPQQVADPPHVPIWRPPRPPSPVTPRTQIIKILRKRPVFAALLELCRKLYEMRVVFRRGINNQRNPGAMLIADTDRLTEMIDECERVTNEYLRPYSSANVERRSTNDGEKTRNWQRFLDGRAEVVYGARHPGYTIGWVRLRNGAVTPDDAAVYAHVRDARLEIDQICTRNTECRRGSELYVTALTPQKPIPATQPKEVLRVTPENRPIQDLRMQLPDPIRVPTNAELEQIVEHPFHDLGRGIQKTILLPGQGDDDYRLGSLLCHVDPRRRRLWGCRYLPNGGRGGGGGGGDPPSVFPAPSPPDIVVQNLHQRFADIDDTELEYEVRQPY